MTAGGPSRLTSSRAWIAEVRRLAAKAENSVRVFIVSTQKITSSVEGDDIKQGDDIELGDGCQGEGTFAKERARCRCKERNGEGRV